jgi:CheY-like chemotaxis protein
MVSVTDTGTGMDEATRARVFEPFFTTKGLGKGTGLGLSTVYGIVRQSAGFVEVSSEAGKGTSFEVYLPRSEGVAAARLPTRAPAVASGTETVLVVEDEEMLRRLAVRTLKRAGYKVLVAANGGEALLQLETFDDPVHLLLTDVVMPGMSGRELADRLRRTRPEMMILFTSGYTDDAILHTGVLDDLTQFIGKPFSTVDLMRKVRDVLDNRA